MGIKGDKMGKESELSAELMKAKLSSIEGITTKKMFGGHGIFHDGKMFGIIDSKGQSLLKVNDSTKADFEEKGATKHSRMPYYSIPIEILENQDELVKWAKKSIEISK